MDEPSSPMRDMNTMKTILDALDELLAGKIPLKITDSGPASEDREIVSRINRLIDFIEEIHGFVIPLSRGELKKRAPMAKNFLASPFKELHSQLSHLTWQAEQVAKGDYSQRIDFMGDFSRSFNAMVEALSRKDESLARTIEELRDSQRALKKRAGQLEEANKELESFSYSVSHELRSPLRAIDAFSRMLMQTLGDGLDGDSRSKLTAIRENTRKMNQLIQDVLDFSRVEGQVITRNVIDMEALALQVWDELQSLDAQEKAALAISSLPEGYGDQHLIRQVFANLLSNAVKYAKGKEAVVIEVGGVRRGDENEYYVKDNGAGFDMQHCDKLFIIFQRLHSQEDYEGTGVGLSIVKRVIQRHGGRVWAEGKSGEGAVFHFTLPLPPGRDRS